MTEGNALAGGIWEHARYEWGKEPGRVTVNTLDSNVWSAGDGWDYRITPSATGGSVIAVDVRRRAHSLKGQLVSAFLSVFGARKLRADMQKVLARISPPPAA